MEKEDLMSEMTIVPQEKHVTAVWIEYGDRICQDDRVCAFTSLMAMLHTEKRKEHPAASWWIKKRSEALEQLGMQSLWKCSCRDSGQVRRVF